MSVAYHWTTRENAEAILRDGLLPGAWLCRRPQDWRGEVCLRVTTDEVIWDDPVKCTWQRIAWNGVRPEHIVRCPGARKR